MNSNDSDPYDKNYYVGGVKSNYTNYIEQERIFDDYWMKYITRYSAISPDKVFLDIGCAYGVLVKKMLDLGWKSSGIDISEYAIAEGKKNYGLIDIQKGSADELPFSDNTFGYITCIDVVEHLEQTKLNTAANEIYRCLKPGGILFAATPNVLDNSLIDTYSENYIEKDTTHINYQSSYDLYRLFYSNNFSKVIVKGSSPFVPQITEMRSKNTLVEKCRSAALSVLMRLIMKNDRSYSTYLFVIAIK